MLNKFISELVVLKALFGTKYINDNFNRINAIYETTEKLWQEQIVTLPESGIKYLLIAEAPPFSPEGSVKNVYNPESEARTLLKSLCKAFFSEPLYNVIGNKKTLYRLSSLGLLIVDSLPFAMGYSAKRGSDKYRELVRLCVYSYMLPKINREDLNWSLGLKVGFAFKRNALTIMDALKDGLFIQKLGKPTVFNTNMIVANDAGYPDANKIIRVFDL